MLGEYLKLTLLGVLFFAISYSGGLKYWSLRSAERQHNIREIVRDYDRYCGSAGAKLEACKRALDSAVDDASRSCKGYLLSEAHCISERKVNCVAKTSAADGCISMVILADLAKAGFAAL